MIARLTKRLQVFACWALLSFSAGVAQAQSPAPIWTGSHLGVHGGGAWVDVESEQEDGGFSASGGLGGLYGGYQWQSGNWVLGAEGDVSFGKLDKLVEFVERFSVFGDSFTDRERRRGEIKRLVSLRARIGHAAGPLQVFATGGRCLDVAGAIVFRQSDPERRNPRVQ